MLNKTQDGILQLCVRIKRKKKQEKQKETTIRNEKRPKKYNNNKRKKPKKQLEEAEYAHIFRYRFLTTPDLQKGQRNPQNFRSKETAG